MPMQQWELQPYEQAARATCSRLSEHPDEPMPHESGAMMPRWVAYAVEMHKLRLMQAEMQNYGPWGPV